MFGGAMSLTVLGLNIPREAPLDVNKIKPRSVFNTGVCLLSRKR
jgi:hypothetical protein